LIMGGSTFWSACCRPTMPSALPRPSAWSSCACCRAGAGRRIWRRGDLCGRTCADGKRGLFTSWITDHRHAGPVPVLLVILGTRMARRSRICPLGLARAVPGVRDPAGDFGVDPPVHGRIAGLRHEGGRPWLQCADTEAFGRWKT
jgi:hypothetical protein